MDDTFFALSHPIRRAMLARLAEGDMSVGELGEPFELSAGAVSKHVRVLKQAGLLRQRRAGFGRECSLQMEPLREALVWLVEYQRLWAQQLDSFAQYVKSVARKRRGNGKRA